MTILVLQGNRHIKSVLDCKKYDASRVIPWDNQKIHG